jgi:hypothetical protein
LLLLVSLPFESCFDFSVVMGGSLQKRLPDGIKSVLSAAVNLSYFVVFPVENQITPVLF